MFWAESGGRGHGQWYEGTVLGYDRRAKDNPLRGSPWASVSVQWKDDHTDGETYENLISPWELAAAGDDSEYVIFLVAELHYLPTFGYCS